MGAILACGSHSGLQIEVITIPLHGGAHTPQTCESTQTPSRHEFPSGVESTPARPLQSHYKYNCPLCLGYYSDILICSCCTQYVCHRCALAMLRENKVLSDSQPIPINQKLNATCPNCCSIGYSLQRVDKDAPIHFLKDQPPPAITQLQSPPIAEQSSKGVTPSAAPEVETPDEREASTFSEERKAGDGGDPNPSLSPVTSSHRSPTEVDLAPKRLVFLSTENEPLEEKPEQADAPQSRELSMAA